MKTTNKVLFFFFLGLMLYFTTNNKSKTNCLENHLQNKIKSEAVLDIMKSLLKPSKSNRKLNNMKAKDAEVEKFKRRSKVRTGIKQRPPGIEIIDKSKVLTEFEKLKVSLEGWMQVSSPELRNPDKYPTITLPDYSTKRIKITNENFRINESFDETKVGPEFPPDELYFWFRISDKNLYYTSDKNSLNIIDSISIKGIVGVTPERKATSTCFDVSDQSNAQWKLCPETREVRHKWICHIQSILGVDDETCKAAPSGPDANVVVQDEKVTDPVILIPLPSKSCNDGWNYKNKGEDWECDCKEGKTQSPIDIDTNVASRSPVKPVFKFQEVEIKVDPGQDSPLKLVYSDGAISMKYNSFGKTITLDGNVFSAKRIVFHTPSQHKIDGRNYDMEVEIIHEGESKDVVAKYLTLCILFEKKPGVYNKFMDQLDFFNLPNPMFKVKNLRNNINLNSILYELDSNEYPLWKPFSFFTYEGSLTAPPCTEQTIVYVKTKPLPLGNTTLELFREAIRVPDTMDEQGNVTINTSEPTSYRNPQPLNGRKVYYYDYVEQVLFNSDARPKETLTGHYEKVTKKMTNYYHINSDQPSGLPGSFVVSEKEAQGFK